MEYQRYVTHVELRVVTVAKLLSGGEIPVGEFVVHAEAEATSKVAQPMREMLDQALARASKSARALSAAVQNTENNRLK